MKSIEEQILERLTAIEETLNNNLSEMVRKSEQLEQTNRFLDEIHIAVKGIAPSVDQNGDKTLKVFYELPVAEIRLDTATNDVVYDPLIVAINRLDLLSYEDIDKIREKVGEMKESQ